jgi:hypothetical protein
MDFSCRFSAIASDVSAEYAFGGMFGFDDVDYVGGWLS